MSVIPENPLRTIRRAIAIEREMESKPRLTWLEQMPRRWPAKVLA